ncbi:MAG: hypothetical protein CNE98_03660 [Bacteroidetes bacterium MED-G17]|jgi:hypothetical protein|nr:MAG: hypothetical protein CNE98_03660 [Bacteroidetes bacterium MED-G17]CAI8272999.1 MAG: Uncharacterised protein [Bacteroidetes bacterium MED-G17]|tara:strand:+ start:9592 stop:10680 length:1089 start_codon:yes stop_codon:yes gene_type:complete
MERKIIFILFCLIIAARSNAGNEDRIGQAGATQLSMNSWAQSAGLGYGYIPMVRGLESMFLNVGGLAFTEQTEIGFSRSNWLKGTDININTFGIAQRVGAEGVLGISVMSMDIGEIEITTTSNPDGGIGTFKPTFNNLALAYSQRFTSSISGGVLLRGFSEGLPNAKAQGIALDAGISYVTTANKDDKVKKDDIKFGISLKNVGPDSKYTGDAFSARTTNDEVTSEEKFTYNIRTALFNLPTIFNVGASYDLRLDASNETYFHRLTPTVNFTYHAFKKNQLSLGLEYGYKNLIMVRGGFAYEEGIFEYETRKNVYTGAMGGITLQAPISKGNKSKFAIDYSYRSSSPFSGTHNLGIRIIVGE